MKKARIGRLGCLVLGALAVAALALGCEREAGPVPGYALFDDTGSVGEVGRGEFHHQDGRQSDFHFFARGDQIREELPSIRAKLDEDEWITAQSSGDASPVLTATSRDGNICIRYLSLHGDYRTLAQQDATLGQLTGGIEREVRFGAEFAVIIDYDCDGAPDGRGRT